MFEILFLIYKICVVGEFSIRPSIGKCDGSPTLHLKIFDLSNPRRLAKSSMLMELLLYKNFKIFSSLNKKIKA